MASSLYDPHKAADIQSIVSDNNWNYRFDDTKDTRGKEYFSGANVRVYFGSIWVETLAAISFSLMEQVTPVYGFHSYTFDRIARGQRLVQGSFTLNFTENGYLQTILDRIALEMRTSLTSEASTAALAEAAKFDTSAPAERTIENLLASGDGDAYADYISALKKSFWGETTSSRITTSSDAKETDAYFYAQENGETDANPLREHGFNILIDYSPDANLSDFEACLKKLKLTGEGSYYQSYRSIIGVHVTGVTENIRNDGTVLSQTYSFIARDLDGDVTKPSLFSNYRYDTTTLTYTTQSSASTSSYTSMPNTVNGPTQLES